MIIGQDKLLNSINNSLNDFPKTNLLVGESGSGRKTIIKYISEKLQAETVDITDKISLDMITDIYLETDRFVYIIDINKISVKDQNTILKFIEEPPASAIIFLLCEKIHSVLPTVSNRCYEWVLEPYTKETLRKIVFNLGLSVDEETYNIFDTPGKIISANNLRNLSAYKELSIKIIQSIKRANYINSLKLTSYFVAQKDETEPKFDLDIFVPILSHYTTEEIINGNSDLDYFYNVILDFSRKIKNKSYNKKMLLDRFFYDLRGSVQ